VWSWSVSKFEVEIVSILVLDGGRDVWALGTDKLLKIHSSSNHQSIVHNRRVGVQNINYTYSTEKGFQNYYSNIIVFNKHFDLVCDFIGLTWVNLRLEVFRLYALWFWSLVRFFFVVRWVNWIIIEIKPHISRQEICTSFLFLTLTSIVSSMFYCDLSKP
jgi:hypothetical protein